MDGVRHTPEEIKKGLEVCAAERGGCMDCPYRHDSISGCITLKSNDALAYIQQLEAKVSALEKRCDAEQLNATYAITEMAEVKSRCLRSIEIISKAFPKWISVEERLPKKSTKCIVCTEKGSVYCTKFYKRSKGGDFGTDVNTVITHWMPLPEPPKEE